ncbi:MAG: hypothetical protein KVP17_000797 [Porospora cf. gigantea B]|uniref:uncharacterized protein n=1 Tax=Porospora cf. gigantea B TaxID=2853592 RepID=UPI003571A93A|nr:MAG: hypothetical protein KVP17_000797 [Porospora cf. gigantea B]
MGRFCISLILLTVSCLGGSIATCRKACDDFWFKCDTLISQTTHGHLNVLFCNGTHGLCTAGCWSTIVGEDKTWLKDVGLGVGLDFLWESLGFQLDDLGTAGHCYGQCNAEWVVCQKLGSVDRDQWLEVPVNFACQQQQRDCVEQCPVVHWDAIDLSLQKVAPGNINKMTNLVDNRHEHQLEAVIDRSAASVRDLIGHITNPRLKQDLLVRMEVESLGVVTDRGDIDWPRLVRSWHKMPANERTSAAHEMLTQWSLRAQRAE